MESRNQCRGKNFVPLGLGEVGNRGSILKFRKEAGGEGVDGLIFGAGGGLHLSPKINTNILQVLKLSGFIAIHRDVST